ncbi:MAG: hypothetical protein HZA17_00325 [Nitrospirae bacterium]|nr:hypothetical protein [Nitrospirota bacterium]
MVRMVTQILAGLMLLFGAATLFPKSYFEFKAKKIGKSIISGSLGMLSLFFSCMAFYYAYLILSREIFS